MNKDSRQRIGFTFKSLVHFALRDPVLKLLYPISPVLNQHQRDSFLVFASPFAYHRSGNNRKMSLMQPVWIWSLKVKPQQQSLVPSRLSLFCWKQHKNTFLMTIEVNPIIDFHSKGLFVCPAGPPQCFRSIMIYVSQLTGLCVLPDLSVLLQKVLYSLYKRCYVFGLMLRLMTWRA